MSASENMHDADNTVHVANQASKYLFLICTKCYDILRCEYRDYDVHEHSSFDLHFLDPSSAIITSCKSCMRESYEHTESESAVALSAMFREIRLHPGFILSSNILDICTKHSDGNKCELVGKLSWLHYRSIYLIESLLSRSCKLASIDRETGELLPYARFGFL